MSTKAVSKRIVQLCICNFISTTKPGSKVERERIKQEQDSLEQLFRQLTLQTLGPNMASLN